MANLLQSPTIPLLLGSNDDQLERTQACATRAAANRCRANTFAASRRPPEPCLSKRQIIDLLNNCVKLASENKINQKNTWELKLIDHLSEVIKVEAENEKEINFQKASCTLEAGVKIYSIRVDSVYSEAYKALVGINRASIEDEQEVESLNGKERGCFKKEPEKKVSPLSTLESSFEALNAKKLDVAFMVDPLYHQTSAQFDEGGTKGLLLNNLGVYGGCWVLFDSFEVPSKCRSCLGRGDTLNLIDLSFVKEPFEQMIINMQRKNEISPSLNEIVCHFDEVNQGSAESFCVDQNSNLVPDVVHDREHDLDNWQHDPWELNCDNKKNVFKENIDSGDATFDSHCEVNDPFASCQDDGNEGFDNAPTFLFQHVGFTTKKNSWAGPDHWKYQRPKGTEDSLSSQSKSTFSSNQFKVKRYEEGDLDFTASVGKENPDIFASPRSPKTLFLPSNRPSYCKRLPEDCHYQPQDIVKLFLLPNIMCLGKHCRKFTDNKSSQQNKCFGETVQSWDNESVISGHYNDGYVCSDVEDSDGLVSHPRRVNKIDVQYDKFSKQVDVQILKDNLWGKIQECDEASEMVPKDAISFKHLFANVFVDWQAVAPEHLSPHLCFICLLHLANEHGLLIQDNPRLDDLSIHLPSSK